MMMMKMKMKNIRNAAKIHVRSVVQGHTQNKLVGLRLRTETTHNQQRIRTSRQRRTNMNSRSLVNESLLMGYPLEMNMEMEMKWK